MDMAAGRRPFASLDRPHWPGSCPMQSIPGVDPKLPPTIVGYPAAKRVGIKCLTHNTGAAQLVLIRDIGQREI